jgi:enoyl-CoA hydratase/carnithine racemase
VNQDQEEIVDLETLRVRQEGAVLFADISAPPMNLLGTELVRDLVSLIQGADADDACHVLVFTSADPDYFISHVDVTRISEYREQAAKLTGEPSMVDVLSPPCRRRADHSPKHSLYTTY